MLVCLAATAMRIPSQGQATKVTVGKDLFLRVDGQPFFVIAFSPGPPPGLKTPDGRDGWTVMRAAGLTALRSGRWSGPWTREDDAYVQAQLDAAAKAGLRVIINLRHLPRVPPGNEKAAAHLWAVIKRFREHPALLAWKSQDEPEWGKATIEPLVEGYRIIKETDPNHPVHINQAPRGTITSLRRYSPAYDITGCDIYPVSIPPGLHSDLPNKNLSVVGDYTERMIKVDRGRKPVWMVLQVTWSGATPPRRPRIFPTLRQERYMTYQAIINGAKGLYFFNMFGNLEPKDQPYGWNWTFWRKVMKPLLAEIGWKSELHPVLLAPVSKRKVKMSGADDVEFLCKEHDGSLYLLAAKRESRAAKVRFSGVPDGQVAVLFEKRSLRSRDNAFSDRFEPNDVHIYRMKLPTRL